jgi:hypothetical protein
VGEDRERRPVAGADEATEEGSSEDVELHRRKSVMQNDEPAGEGQSDDDVELHRRKSVQ